jgi:hypothetical protein
MASLTRALSLTALTLALAAAPAAAQTQADFDACNQHAAAQVPSGAGTITSSTPGTSVGGSVMTAPGSSDVNRVPNASGRISGSAGSPGTGAGTATAAGGGTPATVPSPSTSTTPSASPSSDVQGMAQAGQVKPTYQRAFRD